MQETHSTPESVRKKESKGKSIWHSGTISKSSGVAILFKENSDIEIIDFQKDKAIYSIENGKSPGVDGIPKEFYKEFLETIKYDLQKTCNETLFENQITPKTWNQAVITLIPKKGNTKLLKYWRPISLLCVDYKILTKILD